MPAPRTETLSADALREVWPILDAEERVLGFRQLERDEAPDFFLSLTARSQSQVLLGLSPAERRVWLGVLPPDRVADVVQEIDEDEREPLLALLPDTARREVRALLAYEEDEAGGLMSPRFVRLREDMPVDEAIRYVRTQALRQPETIYYTYVLDRDQRLRGVVSFRELLTAPADRLVRDVMQTELVTVLDDMDAEEVADVIARHDILAVPVLDPEGRMKGIVTVDDVVDVVHAAATEDIHKLGGMEALDAPYFQTSLGSMLRKRGGWLAVLFLGELLTASAMARFEDEIARALVLVLFLPLIVASGGNSGSQASTLMVRAMALGHVRLRDWHRVVRREIVAGIALGSLLGAIGWLRVVVWQSVGGFYGEHYLLVATTVAASLLGIVLLGTIAGAMLPFLLRAAGMDPATASAPLVATLVDVSGVVIYFGVAAVVLRGTLL